MSKTTCCFLCRVQDDFIITFKSNHIGGRVIATPKFRVREDAHILKNKFSVGATLIPICIGLRLSKI